MNANHRQLIRRGILAAAVALGMMLPPGVPLAATSHQHAAVNASTAGGHAEEDQPDELGPVSTSEKQGYGCMIAGGTALVLTSMAGTGAVVGLYTGAATLPPTGVAGLGLAILGTVVASTCAVGALVAPTMVRLWRYYYDGAVIAPSR